MIAATPHHTRTEYLRDFESGALRKFCSENCIFCDGSIERLGQVFRKILAIPIFRGKCSGLCKRPFTFLPLFVAPGKWYGYSTIEEVLIFVSQAAEPHQAFEKWEIERESSTTRIPSTSTVQRWWQELGQNFPERPWLERSCDLGFRLSNQGWPCPLPTCGPDGIVEEKPVPSVPEKPTSFTCVLLRLLLGIGETIFGFYSSPTPASFLGLSLWSLEHSFKQRCLARIDLAGRLIPCASPKVTVTLMASLGYPPNTS